MTRSFLPSTWAFGLLCCSVGCAPIGDPMDTGADDGDASSDSGDDDDDDDGSDESGSDSSESGDDDDGNESSSGSTGGESSSSSSSSGTGGVSSSTSDDPTTSSSSGSSSSSTGSSSSSSDDGNDSNDDTQEGGDSATVSCAFDVDASISPNIGAVGIVEWSVDLGTIDEAEIHFGLDDGYGLVAPVDLSEDNYRTLLLGMKAGSDYHFKIVASGGGETCESDDQMLTTSPRPNMLPTPTIETQRPDDRTGGFKVVADYGSRQRPRAFILDEDGDFVWWYSPDSVQGGEVTSARISYDGKHMWMRNVNVIGGGSMTMRVNMDGSGLQTYDNSMIPGHHDLAVLPDGAVAFIAFEGNDTSCDDIIEMDANGNMETIFKIRDAVGSLGGSCHSNAIHYNTFDDTYTVSQRDFNTIVKFTRSGDLVWVLGGGNGVSSFGGDVNWSVQHGHHSLDESHIIFFNNGPFTAPTSTVIELELDLSAMSATRTWSYEYQNLASSVLGDVQRLPNGNTLVTYSDKGDIQEVTSEGELVERIGFGAGSALGYVNARPTLYGPPPR